MNVDELLAQIDESYINRTVLMKYDEAHARFNLESMAARDQADFNAVITRYIQHHHEFLGAGRLEPVQARGEAVRLLRQIYQENPTEDGYTAAAYEGIHGHMLDVLYELNRALKSHALQDYLDGVFSDHVHTLSGESVQEFRHKFFELHRPALEKFGYREETFEMSGRAGFEYYRKYFGFIRSIGRSGGVL